MAGKVIKRYIPSIVFGVIILIVSLIPINIQSDRPAILFFPGLDKMVHAGMYAFLVFLLLIEILHSERVTWYKITVFPSIVFVYSVIIEIIQHYLIASRSGEILDVAANLAGTIIGVLAAVLFEKIRS